MAQDWGDREGGEVKAYITSIGEKTTELCAWQLQRLGFQVNLLAESESWQDKYKKFIWEAQGEECIRVDADVILNENLAEWAHHRRNPQYYMIQFMTYDLYKNDLGVSSPVYYSTKGLEIIKNHWDEINLRRPEAEAWRLPAINPEHNFTHSVPVGFHGFYQDKKTIERAIKNKIERKQIDQYDFDLVYKIRELGLQ